MLEESPELFLDEIQDWVALSHDIGFQNQLSTTSFAMQV
jgi:hypothetical protein